MSKTDHDKVASLTLKVVAAAMNWYEKDVAMGCVRDNFTRQTLRLWDACVALKEAQKHKQP